MLPKETIVTVSVLSVFVLTGTIGNLLALYVFLRSNRMKTSLFIVALACTDLTASLVTIPFTIAMETVYFKVKSDMLCKLYHFVLSTTVPLSAMTMVAIATERYICVCKSSSNLITKFRTKLAISLIFVGSVILGSLTCVNYGIFSIVSVHDLSNINLFKTLFNISQVAISSDDLRHNATGAHYKDTSESYDVLLAQFLFGKEVSHNSSKSELTRITYIHIVNSELCHNNAILLGATFQKHFTVVYSSLFVMCCVIMVCTYVKLFVFLYRHRSKQQKRRNSEESKQAIHIKKDSLDVSFPAKNQGKLNRRSSFQNRICFVEGQRKIDRHSSSHSPICAVKSQRKVDRRSSSQNRICFVEGQRKIDRRSSSNSPFCPTEGHSNVDRRSSTVCPSIHVEESEYSGKKHDIFNWNNERRRSTGQMEAINTLIQDSNSVLSSMDDISGEEISRLTQSTTSGCSFDVSFNNSSTHSKQLGRNTRRRLSGDPSSFTKKRARSYSKVVNKIYRRKNAKTASSLFLVAFVFIVSFLPAWLMKLNLIPFNILVFNLYFVHNVANPFIYAFLNPEFRKEVKKFKLHK